MLTLVNEYVSSHSVPKLAKVANSTRVGFFSGWLKFRTYYACRASLPTLNATNPILGLFSVLHFDDSYPTVAFPFIHVP